MKEPMKEPINEGCKQLAEAIIKEFLNDHYKSKVIDIFTLELLLENLSDYV